MKTKIKALSGSILNRFLERRDGSVATIFAVSLVPVIIAAGIGVDLSRAMSSRSNLQDALDATALALAHLPADTPQATVDTKAMTWLKANLHDSNMTTPTLTAKLVKGKITLDASSQVSTTLTAVAGYKIIPIKAHSTVEWGLGKVEVALVLDNTGSMSGTKLTRLKAAAKDLVETLEEQISADEPTALKVSVVPFSMTVRLASDDATLNTYKSAAWMKGKMPTQYGKDLFFNSDGNPIYADRFSLFTAMGEKWGGCIESRPDPYDISDAAATSSDPKSYFIPFFAPDEPDYEALRENNWNYYQSVNSYFDDEEAANSSPAKYMSSHFDKWTFLQGFIGKYDKDPDNSYGRGPNGGCTMQPVLRLTTNMTTVKTRLANMNAVGNTNIPIGLMWGWHTLSPNTPFADGVPYDTKDTKKFIVLLTDGDNVNGGSDNPNKSTYSSVGYAWQRRMIDLTENADDTARSNAMDKRMEKICNNIKAKGVTIYAVRIDVSGTAPKELSNCASSAEMFYDIDSTGLSAAFENIAGSIGKIRIAK